MAKVTGLGGVFLKCDSPEKMREWYAEHLGFDTNPYGADFLQTGYSVWSTFKQDTTYFEPSQKDFMINFRVDDLEALVTELKAKGVVVLDEIEVYNYGKFVHILDLEGNKLELWEANDEEYAKLGETAKP